MNKIVTKLLFLIILSSLLFPQDNQYPVDLEVVSQIREEGLHNSDLPNTLSYMTDVLGARLTNSDDMYRAQEWAVEKMQAIGLENIEVAITFYDDIGRVLDVVEVSGNEIVEGDFSIKYNLKYEGIYEVGFQTGKWSYFNSAGKKNLEEAYFVCTDDCKDEHPPDRRGTKYICEKLGRLKESKKL